MSLFSEDALKKLADEFQGIDARYEKLFLAYVQHTYASAKGREYGTHGYPRRLNILVRCIRNVFNLLPQESEKVPWRETRLDAMVNIQAFVVNVFGALDNLAWIWAQEKNITKQDGSALPNEWVGLGPSYKTIRASFPKTFADHLNTLARIRHDGEELRDGCSAKSAIHVANRCCKELHRASTERHSRHDRRYTASLRAAICPA